ncbi:unnamed protein product [Arctia plantaginis]|uniref:Hemolin n=1 Tax=Arctia plantaginis TaxID=874455 RepID=A0A8S0ZK90_ARCPL|nr:unnamed protein product [Arctia plantaginis]
MAWLQSYLLVILATRIWAVHREVITKSSLTFVIDDTASMQEEIRQVKETVDSIFDTVTTSNKSQIENFVLVTFNDPDAKLLTVTKDRTKFKTALWNINIHGGGDCPEYSMKGIKIGLENSLPLSYMYVFTDASAADYTQFEEIKSIAQKNQIQVTFLLTGDCSSRANPDYQVYHKVAKATSGQVFNMMKQDVKDVLEYVVETIKGRDNILVDKTLPSGLHDVEFKVDKKMENVTISVSGSNPTVKVKDPGGKKLETKDIVNKSEIKIVGVPKGEPGVYTAKVGSTSNKSVRVTGKTTLNFEHGFSMYQPLTLSETATRPAPDGNTYLSIQLLGDGVILRSAKVIDTSGNVLQELPLRLINEKDKFYVTDEFNPPSTAFKISVSGYDVETKTTVERMSATPIERQNPKHVTTTNIAPMVKIIDGPKITVDYNVSLDLKCRINGYPKPEVMWIDTNTGSTTRTTVSTIEAPSDYISILKVENANKNYTFECKATNPLGTNMDRIQVVTNIFFNVLETPKDITEIEYDKEGIIPCVVDAQPPAMTSWYKNNKLLVNDTNIVIASDMRTVTIKHMNLESQGNFMCEVRNELNRKVFFSKVNVFGLEKPKISKTDDIVLVTKGDDAQLECRIIEGIPKPTIQWYFQTEDGEKFEEISETSDILRLQDVDIDKIGTYLCIASNEIGNERYAIDLIVEYPPTIKDSDSKLQAKDGDVVTIPCEVDGVPTPKVKWFKDGSPIDHLSDFQITANHTLKWHAKVLSDNGLYTCVAENAFGSTNKTVLVDVFDPPHIELPKLFTIKTTIGQNIVIPCRADGHPRPVIRWIYNDLDRTVTENIRYHKKLMALRLGNIKLRDQGYYTCVASNVGGSTRITYKVEVNDPPVIQKSYQDNSFNAVTGDLMLKISCIATGSPEPTIAWEKDGLNIAFGTEWYDIDNGTLIIKNIDKGSQGAYTCLARNKIGNATMNYYVTVSDYPLITGPVSKMFIEEGQLVNLPCKIPHTRIDTVRWYKNQKIVGKGELIVRRITKRDEGTYSCRISDFEKSSSAHVHVLVGKKPSFITDEEEVIDFLEGDSVPLICEAIGDPEPEKVSWHFNGEEMDVTEMTYHLRMMLDNRGNYTCEVSNDFGTIQRSFRIVTKDCILDMKKDFLKDNEPLLLSASLTWPSFNLFEGYMFIAKNEPFYLHCQKGFRRFPSVNTVMGFCESETNINIQGKIFKYTDIKCNEENEPAIRRSYSSCRPGNTEYIQVGYQVYHSFLEVYDVCLDKKNNVPLYAQHKIYGEQNGVVKNVTKWYRNDLMTLDSDSMYDCRSQVNDISSTIGRPFHLHDDCCFGKRQLVNPKDLRPGVPTAAVYTYLNIVPQWSTCNSKNWDNVEEKVRMFSKSFENTLTVLTGTANRRPRSRSRQHKGIVLHDQRGRKQPVSQYLWKVVQNPASSSSLAIVQVNVPDLSPADVPSHIHCRDICNEIEWMKDTNWHNVADGYTYCCSILDFESAFNFKRQFSRDKTAVLYNDLIMPRYHYSLTTT